MDTLTRTGNVVYDQNRVVVAEWVHGAWYKRKNRSRRGTELVPVESQSEINTYDSLADSRSANIEDADDRLIIEMARESLSGQSSRTINTVTEAVEDGVRYGLGKYGPFKTSSEVRNLQHILRLKIRNAMVFCCMNMVLAKGRADFGEYKNTFVSLARLWMRLRDM